MQHQIIRCKIKLSKVDKTLFYVGPSGEKHLDFTLMPSKQPMFGETHYILQGVTQEARLAGKRGTIIGDGKVVEAKPTEAVAPQPDAPALVDDYGF